MLCESYCVTMCDVLCVFDVCVLLNVFVWFVRDSLRDVVCDLLCGVV